MGWRGAINGVILATGLVAVQVASAASDAGTPVADQGSTRIVDRSAGNPVVMATIVTRRASAAESDASRATRCSGGRTVCSLVDRLAIDVDGKPVDVPPRAVLLLDDVDDARLQTLGRGRYALILTGGDAAPAYRARLSFDAHRVTRLDIWSDEAGMIEQRTIFHDVSKAFR